MGEDLKATLAANVRKCMRHAWGVENLSRLGREARIGTGGAQRITSALENVGPDVIERVARCFGIEGWMLLAPGFDPERPPLSFEQLQTISDQLREVVSVPRVAGPTPRAPSAGARKRGG